MKRMLPVPQLMAFILLVAALASCKKTETITVTVQQPRACFSVRVPDPFSGMLAAGSTTYIDSNFYFQNCSDTGAGITYQWSFGDGATSSDRNPKHAYARRGSYGVTLIVSNDNQAYDTVRQTVSVILGQQHISFGEQGNLEPVAIEETTTGDFVLLAFSTYGSGYHLIQLDSMLRQKDRKEIFSGNRLNSMQPAADGDFIFTGSTQAANKSNELIKLKANGAQVWNKVLYAEDSYGYATAIPGGGYAVVGSRPVRSASGNITSYTVVVKTDGSGNPQWQKVLDVEGMTSSKDAVVEPDGIVVAGVKRRVSGPCWDCDSLIIVKLDHAGNPVWKNTVLWGLNTNNLWSTRITRLPNGAYAVSNESTRGIFIFSPSGSFLDRKLADYQVSSVLGTPDGNLVVLQSEWGNGNRIAVSKITPDGLGLWSANPEGRQKMAGGYSCCSSSWPVAVRPLRNGGTLVTGYRVNNNATGYGSHNVIVLLQLDEEGKRK